MKQSTLSFAVTNKLVNLKAKESNEENSSLGVLEDSIPNGQNTFPKDDKFSESVNNSKKSKTPIKSPCSGKKAKPRKKQKLSLSNKLNVESETSIIGSEDNAAETVKETLTYSDFLATIGKEIHSDRNCEGTKKDEATFSSQDATADSEQQQNLLAKSKQSQKIIHADGNETVPLKTDSDSMSNDECSSKEKATMSYSDFLGMFKPALPSVPETVDDLDSSMTDKTQSDVCEVREETTVKVKCKPISSFFIKSSAAKSAKPIDKQQSMSLTVIAEVHPKKGSVKSKVPPSPLKLRDHQRTNQRGDHDEIELLSSETVVLVDEEDDLSNNTKKQVMVDEEDDISKSNSTKKQVLVDEDVSNTTKKQVLDDEDNDFCNNTKKRKNCQEPESSNLTKKQRTDTCEKTTKQVTIERKVTDEIESVDTDNLAKQQTLKTTQSQLCFGKTGLIVSKGDHNDKNNETDHSAEKDPIKKKRGRLPKNTCNKTEENNLSKSKSKTVETAELPESVTRSDESGTNELGNETTSNESPCLRRSSRVSRPVLPVYEPEVVAIGDDDSDSNDVPKIKKKQKGSKPSADDKDQSKTNSTKKPKGNLAPIFTCVKPKEEVKAPPEDPEKARLRREFMMSGIPDELKKQIATSNTMVTVAGYPPFPKPSHVQRLGDEALLTSREGHWTFSQFDTDNVMLNLRCESQGRELHWCIQTPKSELSLQDFNFTNFQPAVDKLDVASLLTEWKRKDSKFPFDSTFARLSLSLKVNNQIQKGLDASKLETPSKNYQKKSKKPKDDDDVDVLVIDDDSPKVGKGVENSTAIHPDTCLWSDLHQPKCSKEIVGNSGVLSQLKSWLQEWKIVMQKDVRKKSKLSNQKPSKIKGKGLCLSPFKGYQSDWSDSSDFTDSDEDDEDSRLCNTMVLAGPHGVGKTAAIYALAHELEYKVFEVNSSSLRSGRQILSQLEEATQSHRVAPSKMQKSLLLDTPPAGTPKPSSEEQPLSKIRSKTTKGSAASAFATLFNPSVQKSSKPVASNVAKPKTKEKKVDKKVTKNADTDVMSKLVVTKSEKNSDGRKKRSKTAAQGNEQDEKTDKLATGSQNLATTSLILFDEADVVFEEDKGFLATVEYLMTTTKIPIVLTTVSGRDLQLQARHDTVVFRRPPITSSISYLCCVCLAHGLHVPRRALERLLKATQGDLRKCLLLLEFWCQSGGGRRIGQDTLPACCDDKQELVHATKKDNLEQLINVPSPSVSMNEDSNSCDFLAQRKTSRRSKRSVVDDEDSNSCDFLALRKTSHRSKRMVVDDDDQEEDDIPDYTNDSEKKVDVKQDDVFPITYTNVAKRKKLTTSESFKLENKINPLASDEFNKLRSVEEKSDPVENVEAVNDEDSLVGDYLHLDLVESVQGLQHKRLEAQSIMDVIQLHDFSSKVFDDALQLIKLIDDCVHTSTVYRLALHSNIVPKCDPPKIRLTLPSVRESQTKKKNRRRIIVGSWLDSDCSSDESSQKETAQDASQIHTVDDAPANQTSKDTKTGDERSNTSTHSSEPRETNNSCEQSAKVDCKVGKINSKTSLENQACQTMLSDLAHFYDSVSTADVFESFYSTMPDHGAKLSPSMIDDDPNPLAQVQHCYASELNPCVRHSVNLLAARKLCQGLDSTVNSWRKKSQGRNNSSEQYTVDEANAPSWPDELNLSVGVSIPDLFYSTEKVQILTDSATRNVASCVGPVMQVREISLHTDYLPYLREICRAENIRHLAKTQRRFHHYLDNCGLNLKKSTIASLTSTFTESSN